MNTIDNQIKNLESKIKSIEDQSKELLSRIEDSAFKVTSCPSFRREGITFPPSK